MKTEFLKSLGIEEEVITKIMSENGKDIEKYKTLSETQKTELENVKTQLVDANKQIEDFKGMNIDEIKKSAEEYKTKFETAEQEHQNKLLEIEFNSKLEKFVNTQNLKNDIYKKALIDRIKEKDLRFDNDVLLGGDDLVKSFKETYSDAFEDVTPKPQFGGQTPGVQNDASDNELRIAMGLEPKK